MQPQSVPSTGLAAGNWYSSFPPPTCKFTFLVSSVERGCVANNIIRFLLISLIVQLFIQLPFSHGEIKTILLIEGKRFKTVFICDIEENGIEEKASKINILACPEGPSRGSRTNLQKGKSSKE